MAFVFNVTESWTVVFRSSCGLMQFVALNHHWRGKINRSWSPSVRVPFAISARVHSVYTRVWIEISACLKYDGAESGTVGSNVVAADVLCSRGVDVVGGSGVLVVIFVIKGEIPCRGDRDQGKAGEHGKDLHFGR